MRELKVRCSRLGDLMTSSRSKKDVLSETAKSYIKEVAFLDFFGIQKEVSTKQMAKGIEQEDESISLLNLVSFEDYKKNEKHFDNGWLTGTPDIIGDDVIIDIKTAWSLETFPMLKDEMDKYVSKGKYEWQVRGYMMLTESNRAMVVSCMVDTPDDLLSDWDDELIHKVDYIQPNKRVSYSDVFERDYDIEKLIKDRYNHANEYYKSIINELERK